MIETAQAEVCGSLVSNDRKIDWIPLKFTPARTTEAIRDAFMTSMEQNDKIVMLGEDIRDPYGGAFKVTAGLSSRWPDRVFSTPISEAGIVGMANGLALAGWRPVVEIMFGDFLMLAADQIINHAAKFAWMYNGKVSVPIIIRTPMGGYRGYGPTHSQSLEKHLLGLPGTRVIALTHRFCPGRLYRTLLQCVDRPTIVIENKLLYGQKTDSTPPPGWQIEVTGHLDSAGQDTVEQDTVGSDATFPTVRLRPPGPAQLTLVAYGGMVPLVEQAVKQLQDEEDLACELLIPTQLYPLVAGPMIESVARTGRLLVVEEGQGFAGFASELIAQLACQVNGATAARFARMCAVQCPIPAARSAEQQVLPSVASIVAAARQLVLSLCAAGGLPASANTGG
jgi:pyruvate/2-oxoglutarate/acetoin dehydrogenase E1 component